MNQQIGLPWRRRDLFLPLRRFVVALQQGLATLASRLLEAVVVRYCWPLVWGEPCIPSPIWLLARLLGQSGAPQRCAQLEQLRRPSASCTNHLHHASCDRDVATRNPLTSESPSALAMVAHESSQDI